MNGKGDKRRDCLVSEQQEIDNWERISPTCLSCAHKNKEGNCSLTNKHAWKKCGDYVRYDS